VVDSVQAGGSAYTTPIAKPPSGSDTSVTFPVAAKTIAASLGEINTLPPKPEKLSESLERASLEMNVLRNGGRGANINLIT